MRIIDFSIRRPVTVFIFAVAAVVFGLVAFRELAVDLLPDITYPSLTVSTELEGAAPVEIENLITKPIEEAAGVVNNVVRVSSSSRAGSSEVTLEFAWGTNMDFASLDVRERLDVLRLPIEAEKPVLLRYDPSLDPILRIGLTGEGELVRLRRIAEEEIKRSLERVEGVAAVVVSGGLEEEIQVEVDERRLASLGLSINQVVNRLAQENVNLTGGRLKEGQTEYLVRTVNELLRAEDLRDIVVDRSQGAIVRVADVARVFKGAKEREVITRIDGRESVEVAVFKEGGTNTVSVANDVTERLDTLRLRQQQIDPSLELTVITDQARYIRESIDAVKSSAILGGSLAVLVLFLFLRSAKNTLIIGISIPVSVMATFFLMYVSGLSVNIMSLGGLTLGIGLLLDNSIVVLEAIQRRREAGMGVVEAAEAGASEVGRAVVASTVTTVCVFVPIVFVEGIAGQLFGDQALTVTYSLVVSLLVALTVIPMLASRQVDWRKDSEPVDIESSAREAGPVIVRRLGAVVKGFFSLLQRLTFSAAVFVARTLRFMGGLVLRGVRSALEPPLAAFDRGLALVAITYRYVLERALRNRALTVAVTVLLLVGSLLLVGDLGRELVPELVQGEFFIDTELPPGSRLEVTSRRMQGLERRAADLPGVRTVYTLVGTSSEQGGTAGEKRENIGQLVVTLEPPTSREREEALFDEMRGYLEEQNRVFAGNDPTRMTEEGVQGGGRGQMDYRFGRPSYFSFRTPLEIEIRGYNLTLLRRLADDLVQRLHEIEGLADIKSSTEGGNPELQIFFDRDRLIRYGYSVAEVGNLIRAKVQGEIATDIAREDRNIDIRLRADERFRDSVRDLRNLNIRGSGTPTLPLEAVADVIETEGPAEIKRADGSRVALITANLVGRDLGSASADIEEALAAMQFPPGFDKPTIGGQREEMETSFDSMRLAILLAVFMVYLVMASQFESLLHPLVILFSVPFSIIGAVAALVMTRTTVSIVVLIGGILLAGIVVNNAIILVDYTNRLREEGLRKLDALRQAGQVRLRPILMTTTTTVLGLLPMALGLGEGSELRAPMALTVIGGLLTSTLLTLVLIPVVYSLLDRGR